MPSLQIDASNLSEDYKVDLTASVFPTYPWSLSIGFSRRRSSVDSWIRPDPIVQVELISKLGAGMAINNSD
jgi:hypothetical protein